MSESSKKWYSKNKEKHGATCKARVRNLRFQALSLLGNECKRCGFTDYRALQIDHINGGGSKERKEGKGPAWLYKKILATNGDGYQILCANCNQIKKYENHEV